MPARADDLFGGATDDPRYGSYPVLKSRSGAVIENLWRAIRIEEAPTGSGGEEPLIGRRRCCIVVYATTAMEWKRLGLPVVAINGMTVQVDAQIQYRAGDGTWPEHISDPEIRYSFRIPNTDLWKSGNITTGRGMVESVTRKIAELPDDAKYRDRVAETKRRQIAELTGLQDRVFTHADELIGQRRRLAEVMVELEKSTNPPGTPLAVEDDQQAA